MSSGKKKRKETPSLTSRREKQLHEAAEERNQLREKTVIEGKKGKEPDVGRGG